jgi:hypothetical protein
MVIFETPNRAATSAIVTWLLAVRSGSGGRARVRPAGLGVSFLRAGKVSAPEAVGRKSDTGVSSGHRRPGDVLLEAIDDKGSQPERRARVNTGYR